MENLISAIKKFNIHKDLYDHGIINDSLMKFDDTGISYCVGDVVVESVYNEDAIQEKHSYSCILQLDDDSTSPCSFYNRPILQTIDEDSNKPLGYIHIPLQGWIQPVIKTDGTKLTMEDYKNNEYIRVGVYIGNSIHSNKFAIAAKPNECLSQIIQPFGFISTEGCKLKDCKLIINNREISSDYLDAPIRMFKKGYAIFIRLIPNKTKEDLCSKKEIS